MEEIETGTIELSPQINKLYKLSTPLENKDVVRYNNINRILEKTIVSLVEKGLKIKYSKDCEVAFSLFNQVPEESKIILQPLLVSTLKEWFNSGTWDAMATVASVIDLIDQVPKENKKELQELLTPIIKESLEGDRWSSKIIAAELITYTTENDQKDLYKLLTSVTKKAFSSDNFYDKKRAADIVEFIPNENGKELQELLVPVINKLLNSPDVYGNFAAIKMMDKMTDDKEKSKLIETVINNENWYKCKTVAPMIDQMPDVEKIKLQESLGIIVEKGLTSHNWDVYMMAFNLMKWTSETDKDRLQKLLVPVMKESLKNMQGNLPLFAAKLFGQIPNEDKAEMSRLLVSTIKELFKGDSGLAARMIEYAPENEKLTLLEIGAQSNNMTHIRPILFRKMDRFSYTQRDAILSLYIDNKEYKDAVLELAKDTSLYKAYPNKFYRKSFDKTGTETTLLDKVPLQNKKEASLRNKIIIRHIPLQAFLNWKTAYEATQTWKDLGFDYIPVEPIVGVGSKVSPKNVDVFTRVIQGPSLGRWSDTYLYNDYINEKRDKITEGLELLGVRHGHTHDNNFVVYFDKDDNGNIDLTKNPRVYVIDFDMAVSEMTTSKKQKMKRANTKANSNN